MKNKKTISIVIFALAALMFILGVVQLALYLPGQLKMLADAKAQGADAQQVSDYVKNTFIPQIITYVITFIGFTSVLVASGLLSLGLMKAKKAKTADDSEENEDSQEEQTVESNDVSAEGFEIAGEENQIEENQSDKNETVESQPEENKSE